jgi:hypothetical protein
MENLFNSIGTKLYETGNHHGYLIEWKLISPFLKKWSHNRDPDMARVSEMHDYYINGGYIPNTIHIAELSNEGLVCYDGNHRREVFNKSINNHNTCIIDVMFNATQSEVFNSFNNINKYVQVPAIFVESESPEIKLQIIELVKQYESNYKPFVSSSSRCISPNFNRDQFIDNIYNIYKDLQAKYTIEDISKALIKLNQEYANGNMCRSFKHYRQNVIDKCSKYGLWLFLDKQIPSDHVEKILTRI